MNRMKKINCFLIVFFLGLSVSFAQKSLNNYKYVIVPTKYEFQKKEDQYQINSLVKFLFEKEGFLVIMEGDQYPIDLSTNHCLAVTANLISESTMMSTKIYFELLDCKGELVVTTNLAKTKEKDYKRGYHEVIRKSFETIKSKNYKYQPIKPVVAVVPTVSTPVVVEASVKTPTKIEVVVVPVTVKKADKSTLYAQEIPNGYQLVDSTPKVVYIALKTSMKDVYMIKGSNGTISKKNGIWIAEYYEGDTLIQKELNIKLME